MGKKKRIKALRMVYKCWTGKPLSETTDGCRRLGCKYADGDCSTTAMLDAIELADELWRELKRVQRSKNDE